MKRGVCILILAFTGIALSGCLAPKMYVDNRLPAASKADIAVSSNPQPIQVLYEFQTKDSANARATDGTRETVMGVINDSGVFSGTSVEPQPNQRRLTIVINNVPVTENAAGKGVGVGLTFGLVGTVVTDGYICKAVLTVPGTEPVALQYNHALHTSIGNTEGPPGIVPEPSIKEAVEKMVRQLIWSVMRDISKSKAL